MPYTGDIDRQLNEMERVGNQLGQQVDSLEDAIWRALADLTDPVNVLLRGQTAIPEA